VSQPPHHLLRPPSPLPSSSSHAAPLLPPPHSQGKLDTGGPHAGGAARPHMQISAPRGSSSRRSPPGGAARPCMRISWTRGSSRRRSLPGGAVRSQIGCRRRRFSRRDRRFSRCRQRRSSGDLGKELGARGEGREMRRIPNGAGMYFCLARDRKWLLE